MGRKNQQWRIWDVRRGRSGEQRRRTEDEGLSREKGEGDIMEEREVRKAKGM